MTNSNKIRIFAEFIPYLRIINALDSANFGHRDWRQNLRNVRYAFCALVVIVMLPVSIMLGVWFLIEHNADVNTCVVAFPLLTSILQMHLTFVALLMNRRTLSEAFDQLQRSID